MVEAAYTSRTPDLAVIAPPQSPMLRLAIQLPGLDSPDVAKAVNSVSNTVEAATSYEGLGHKAAVGQSNDNYSLRAMLRSNLSQNSSVRDGQEVALDSLTHNSSGKQVAAAYEKFARASAQPSAESLTAAKPNPRTSGTVVSQQKNSLAAKGPAAFGKTGFSPTLTTLAQGSSATFSKNTSLSAAALRGPVSMRMPIADSVRVLNAARHAGPRTMQPAPVIAAAPAFTASAKPWNYGRTLSTGPR